MPDENVIAERVNAWQCIGCGRIEAAQPCIGICEDRRVQFVYASDHDATLAHLARARRKAESLEACVRRLAGTTPLAGQWERTYRALQDEARRALRALSSDAPGPAEPTTERSRWPA
jgi:hypothetical protein